MSSGLAYGMIFSLCIEPTHRFVCRFFRGQWLPLASMMFPLSPHPSLLCLLTLRSFSWPAFHTLQLFGKSQVRAHETISQIHVWGALYLDGDSQYISKPLRPSFSCQVLMLNNLETNFLQDQLYTGYKVLHFLRTRIFRFYKFMNPKIDLISPTHIINFMLHEHTCARKIGKLHSNFENIGTEPHGPLFYLGHFMPREILQGFTLK